MKKSSKYVMVLLMLSITFVSCKKWFNKDISMQKVSLLSPPNNHSDSILSKHFWWEEMEGANEYLLQIVSPSFDSIVRFYVDTLLADNQFKMTLIPGKYQWRVRGVNNGYESKWNTWDLVISSTQSINGQSIVPITPLSNLITNVTTHLFSWEKLLGADSYTFKIINNSNGSVVLSEELDSTKYNYTFKIEGNFSWTVQAINEISASYKSENTITIDTTAPSNVTLTSHLNDTITTFPSNFTWTIPSVTPAGSAIIENLIIASDSLLTNTVLDTIVNSSPFILTISPGNAGIYYWGIKRVDAAGNKSVGVLSRRFYIQ